MAEDLVRMVTELTKQGTQFHEMRLELGRLATTTSQAEERAREAEEKARAAATVGMLRGVLGEVETFWSLAPHFLARPMLELAAAFRDQAFVTSDVVGCDIAHGNPFNCNLEALGPFFHKVCRGSAGVKFKAVLTTDRFNAWRADHDHEL